MIFYTVIVRSSDATILVESFFSGFKGNYSQVAQCLIDSLHLDKKLVPNGNRKIFVYKNQQHDCSLPDSSKIKIKDFWGGIDDLWGTKMGDNRLKIEIDIRFVYFFHVLHEDGLLYICLSDDETSQQQCVNFSYLRNIQHEFTVMYNPVKIKRGNAYGMDNAFSKPIKILMHYYNTHRDKLSCNEKILHLNTEVENLKSIMANNISITLSRVDDLEAMVRQSDEMLEESQVFCKRCTKLKKSMQYKSLNYKLLLTLFGLLLTYIILSSFCGILFSRCLVTKEYKSD